MKPLGRRIPKDFVHVEKYPLKAVPLKQAVPKPVPIVAGTNWYSNFDKPIQDKDGSYWVGRGNLGTIRGGHAYMIPFATNKDATGWYSFYDQGSEGACVGFAASRMQSHNNRRRYDARWLYKEAQVVDEWPGEDYDGTSVRAAMDVLRDKGHVRLYRGRSRVTDPVEGIHTNRWATNVDELFDVLQNPLYRKKGAFPFHNSWGKSYPKTVWMPAETVARLLNEDSEYTIVTDK